MSYLSDIAGSNGVLQVNATGAKALNKARGFVSNDAIISEVLGKQKDSDTAVSIKALFSDDLSKAFINGVPITPQLDYYITSITLVSGSYLALF